MSEIDRYITDVMKNVFASKERKEQFEADLRAHIEEKTEAGEAQVSVLRKMGEPEDVAREFMADIKPKLASFWERLLAFILDFAICFALASLFFMFFYVVPSSVIGSAFPFLLGIPTTPIPGVEHGITAVMRTVMLGFFLLASLGVLLFYFPLLEFLFGATVGKMLLRLRVVKEGMKKINLGDAIIRRLSFYFDILFIDALFIPFTKNRQRAFDIVAKTLVIREEYKRFGWINTLVIIGLFILPFICYAVIMRAGIMDINIHWLGLERGLHGAY